MKEIKLLLEEIVKIKSLSGSEHRLANFIIDYLKENKVNVISQDGNVVVHLNNNSKKCLVFNAHLDTVDTGSIKLWNNDPLKLVEKDNKYYGLGVSDEKISIAILIDLIISLKDSKINTDLIFVFVVKEEIDGSGSESFVNYFIKNYNYDKISCVICEPTNASFIELGNKGNIFLEVTTKGVSNHSSKPNEATNAVDLMFDVIKKSKDKINTIGIKSKQLGETTIAAPTKINAGDSVNKIPDVCTAIFDIRTIPETHDIIMPLLNASICSNVVAVRNHAKPCRPSITAEHEHLVKLFERLGINEKRYTPGSNDACFFTNIGIPCVVFGAGSKESIHKPNEYLDIENIERTKEVYLKLINIF